MIKNYFKIAWRNIGKSKMHSFINIAGLSIGMAVAILIGLWMHDELSFNKNFKNYDRIAQVIQNVTNNGEVQTWWDVPYPLSNEIRTNYGSNFKHISMAVSLGDHVVTIVSDNHTASVGDKKLKGRGGFFEKEMPEMFTLDMLQGNRNALYDPSSVIISESTARAYFGNDDAINKMIAVDQMPPMKVAGVYKDFPVNSTFADLSFISSWDFYYNNNDIKSMEEPWRPNFVSLFVELNDNISFAAASASIKDAKFKKVSEQLQKKKPELFLMPMSKWHLYTKFKNGVNVGGAIQYVWLFGIIGVFVCWLVSIL